MNKVFVAFPYKPNAGAAVRRVVDRIGRLIKSHSLVTVTGESLGGDALTPGVQKLIRDSDALIALFTREDRIGRKNRWRPTQWVHDEITTARNSGKPAIALVEPDVEVRGLFAESEYIPLDLRNPLEALLQLSNTIGEWKDKAGRDVWVRLLPDAAAEEAKSAQYKVRLVPQRGPSSNAQADLRIRPGGVFLFVPGVKENDALDVQILDGNGLARWTSGEFPQWMHVQMTRNVG